MVEASNLQVIYNKHFDEVHGRLDDIQKELGAVQLSIGSLRRRDVGVFTNSLCEHTERDLQDMNSCKTDLIGDSLKQAKETWITSADRLMTVVLRAQGQILHLRLFSTC